MVKTHARVQGAVPKQSRRKNAAQQKPVSGFMLGDHIETVAPSWLIENRGETAKPKNAKPRKLKAPTIKTRAKTKTTTVAKAVASKPATRKPRIKAAAKTIIQPEPVVIAVTPVTISQDTPVVSAPIARNLAPVVWQKNGPMGAIGYWLRATGRNMMARFGVALKPPRTNAPIGAKLRTKDDLLREIAILRKENAAMRDRLGLPQMPFGQLQTDLI